MMTLRQVEVIRAVMVTGTIGGAAKLLNVSAPGISRLVKYTEKSLGIRFFQRQSGRYFPTPEAQNIFEQINGVYKKVDDLTEIISKRPSFGRAPPAVRTHVRAEPDGLSPSGRERSTIRSTQIPTRCGCRPRQPTSGSA